LLTDPVLLVADEPVSMLDVSIRAGVLNLMREIEQERSLTSIYISHDLALLRYMCTRTAVMYLGTICEIGPTAELIEHPRHPYTQALVSAVPDPDPEAPRRTVRVADSVPTPFHLPPGCPFADRCPEVMDICRHVRPLLHQVGSVEVACHLYPDGAGQSRESASSAQEAR
jgi:oligopeptide/dipeptide ABC transporter ATP-binding protein